MSILFRVLPLGQRIVTRVKPEASAQSLEQLKSLREQIEAQLQDFLTTQSDYFTAIAPELKPAATSLTATIQAPQTLAPATMKAIADNN